MFGKKNNPAPAAAPSADVSSRVREGRGPTQAVISSKMTVRGEIESGDDIWIDGRVEGRVQGQKRVVVGPRGRVLADIEAQVVEVMGYVKGNIAAHERLRLGEDAHVEGDIRTRKLVVEEKAYITGRVEMIVEAPAAEPAEGKPVEEKVPAPVREASSA